MGGITCFGGSPVISNNFFYGNYATEGAGIFCENANPVISNNQFLSNSAQNRGGAINMTLGVGQF